MTSEHINMIYISILINSYQILKNFAGYIFIFYEKRLGKIKNKSPLNVKIIPKIKKSVVRHKKMSNKKVDTHVMEFQVTVVTVPDRTSGEI